jgi:penicillin V acylase-like amidase (Ntn superfamily)
MEVERILKQQLSDDCHTINGEEVEWISPYSSLTTTDLINMIEDIIHGLNKPVRKVKKQFLPFKDAEWQDVIDSENIELYPNEYTETV